MPASSLSGMVAPLAAGAWFGPWSLFCSWLLASSLVLLRSLKTFKNSRMTLRNSSQLSDGSSVVFLSFFPGFSFLFFFFSPFYFSIFIYVFLFLVTLLSLLKSPNTPIPCSWWRNAVLVWGKWLFLTSVLSFLWWFSVGTAGKLLIKISPKNHA